MYAFSNGIDLMGVWEAEVTFLTDTIIYTADPMVSRSYFMQKCPPYYLASIGPRGVKMQI